MDGGDEAGDRCAELSGSLMVVAGWLVVTLVAGGVAVVVTAAVVWLGGVLAAGE